MRFNKQQQPQQSKKQPAAALGASSSSSSSSSSSPMAAPPSSGPYKNMYDPRLKPRMLRALVSDHLPYEEGPVSGRPEMSNVASTIRTFRLLSESLTASPDAELAQDWKAAVDAWVQRVLELVTCALPDKNWVGICMLGLTCAESSSDRFLASYTLWLDKLVSHIEPPSEFQSVKVASCSSISELLTRLGRFTNAKRDGMTHAAKVFQPTLMLLTEDTSEAVLDGAIALFYTILTSFPSTVLRHYANAEATLVSKILSGRSSIRLLKRYAQCLALLPKAKGDEEYWSLMMQKILLSVNVYLSDGFQGLEEGSQAMTGEAVNYTIGRSKSFLISTVPALIFCCSTMLTSSYPVQVNVPVSSLLRLIMRVLMVDGSCVHSPRASFPVIQQEFISPELPVLHSCSLDLLSAIIKSLRSQLLPHAAEIIRLLIWYFKQCALPTLRVKLYYIARDLLISMGIGLAVHIATDLIRNVYIDLDATGYENNKELHSLFPKTVDEDSVLPIFKGKQASNSTSLIERKSGGLSEEPPTASPISLKIAALEALEALLTVGGCLGSQQSSVDLLLTTVATNACDGELNNQDIRSLLVSPCEISTWTDFQLASLRALLASFLSSALVCPRFLSQGLELFQKGKREAGTKLADFCAHALSVMEVLMHPRFLPPADVLSAKRKASHCAISTHSGGKEYNATFSTSQGAIAPDTDVFLNEAWLDNNNEVEAPWHCPSSEDIITTSTRGHSTTHCEHNSGNSRQLEKLPMENFAVEQRRTAGANEGTYEEDLMLDLDQFSDIIDIGCANTPMTVRGTSTNSELEFRPAF